MVPFESDQTIIRSGSDGDADVYKRQGQRRWTGPRHEKRPPVKPEASCYLDGIWAVSYTHLDVYKRQVVALVYLLFATLKDRNARKGDEERER